MKKHEAFRPELDGKGRVVSSVDSKTLKRVNAKPKNRDLADKLRSAIAKRNGKPA
jgi:hypothetical protein